MKKVLILAHNFHVKEDIGSIRIQGLAKYLPQFGWEPVVFTNATNNPIKSDARVIDTPDINVLIRWKKILGLNVNLTFKDQFNLQSGKDEKSISDYFLQLFEEIFFYPDNCRKWINHSRSIAHKTLESEHFDAIISSSYPVSLHLLADDLKIRYQIPWVADFRDLWTQNHYYSHWKIRSFFEKRLEAKTLSLADSLVTVSQPLSEKLSEFHQGKKVYVIPNGFDPDEINPGLALTTKFTITYTGYLYKGRRDPEVLFKVIHKLIQNKKIDSSDVSIDFFGPKESWMKDLIKKYNLEQVVHVHGPVSRKESIRRQRESHLLLILTWDDFREKGVVTGKIFEYLAAKRPIISLGFNREGSLRDLLEKTNTGVTILSDEDLEKMLTNYYQQYKRTGNVAYEGIDSEIDKYSQVYMAKQFSEILNKVC